MYASILTPAGGELLELYCASELSEALSDTEVYLHLGERALSPVQLQAG